MKKIFRLLKRVRLSEGERAHMRQALREYMAEYPARVADHPAGQNRMPLYRPAFFLGVTALLVSFVGAAYAAEGTVPGDWLYPIKIRLSENAERIFLFSDESQTEWEAVRAARRLKEAEALAKRGELNAPARAKLEQQFERHIRRVQSGLAELAAAGRQDKAAALGRKFAASLRAHELILERLESGEIAESFAFETINAEPTSSTRTEPIRLFGR
ncbi:MAG: hypothetical protein UY92_C0003G0035 [Candidatus Magasanikbacteria bacterium GW2011_GWA2_56_11]|uniref:DUF5667 domain-containing protein n=1 Tax=Candidatus Magasanikbacteria bacterium GW2011_GWA2_56_11 TaxID=1619044 RepID=A0A0G2BBC0_9BACT|nr:MAG: hypothetical protein UY92_C0003G0035 [Candidatus Magasanikbacteria bacterium GW2011_GWA2_56_11]